MHKKNNCWSLLSAKQLLLTQNASAVRTSINLRNQTLKAITLNNKQNNYLENSQQQHRMKLVPACQTLMTKPQIKNGKYKLRNIVLKKD